MTYRLLVALFALTLFAMPLHAQDDVDAPRCKPLSAAAMDRITKVMDLVQSGKAAEALSIADGVVRGFPCHVSFQARASCEQLLKKHRLAIDDFRRAYGLVKESYDLEGIARSAIAIGDLQMAARVAKALRTFPYKSQPERARGMRCVEAIAAAAEVLLEKEQGATPVVPVSNTAPSGEGE